MTIVIWSKVAMGSVMKTTQQAVQQIARSMALELDTLLLKGRRGTKP